MPIAGLPPEVTDILTKTQIYSGAIVVSLSGTMAMVAGLMRTLGLREEGKKRYKDALAGMTMVITAPAVIGIVATILKAFFPETVALIHVGHALQVMFL